MKSTLFFYGTDLILKSLKEGRLPVSSDWSILEPYFSFDHWHQGLSQPVTEQEILAGLREQYDILPDSIRSLLAFDEFLGQREKFEGAIRQKIQQSRSTELSGYARERINKTSYIRFFNSALVDFGWQQLAENYKGLCLGIRTNASCLTAGVGRPISLQPVKYGGEHLTKVDKQNPIPGAFHDVSEHSERGEWRAVFPTAILDELTLKLNKGDVERVYYSVHASEALIEGLKALIKLDLRYRNTKLFQVHPDASHWRLTATAIQV